MVLRNMASYCSTTRRYNPEDHDLNVCGRDHLFLTVMSLFTHVQACKPQQIESTIKFESEYQTTRWSWYEVEYLHMFHNLHVLLHSLSKVQSFRWVE